MADSPFARRLFAVMAGLLLAALALTLLLALTAWGLEADLPRAVPTRADFARRLLLVVVLVAAAALPAAWILARRLTEPLRRLRAAAAAMAAGASRPSQPQAAPSLPVSSGGEIGAVALALQGLADSARASTEAVRNDRNRLLTVLAGMVEGVVAVDRDEKVVALNAAAARILRCDASDAVGRRIWEVTRVRPLGEALSEARRDGSVVTREARVVRDAREQILSLHASPLRDGEEHVIGAVAVLHDITELRRLEDIRRDFVANVSHELKTPLTAIGALVETLLEDDTMDRATRDRFLGKVLAQTGRLSAMVRDLLSLSRIESREARPEFQPVDLRQTARLALQTLQAEAAARQVAVAVELPDKPVEVLGEEEPLNQLVGNLVENAVKYTPAGGTVTVRLGAGDGGVVLEVEDTGVGIDRRHHERIFERFYRVDKGRSRDVGGTGLGLSIVKHVALTHGGRVTLTSDAGQGSIFRVWLPAAPGRDRA